MLNHHYICVYLTSKLDRVQKKKPHVVLLPQICPICLHALETMPHLLHCMLASSFWNRLLKAANLVWVPPIDVRIHLALQWGASEEDKKYMDGRAHAAVWSIWLESKRPLKNTAAEDNSMWDSSMVLCKSCEQYEYYNSDTVLFFLK